MTEMTEEQLLNEIMQAEAEEAILEAEVVTAEETVETLRAKLDAVRERKARALAALAKLKGSQRKAAEAIRSADHPVGQASISRAVSAVREHEKTGKPVIQALREIEHPPKNEYVGCMSGDNAWEELEAAMSRIPEQSYPLSKKRWNQLQKTWTKVQAFAEEDLSCKTPHER